MMLVWRKAKQSAENGNCVEVAGYRDGLVFRDSKNPATVLIFSRRATRSFIAAVKSGKLG
jgi:Domain of unknown function (DUF397)